MRRVIGIGEAIDEISEILTEASGEYLATAYRLISGKFAIYENGKIIVDPDSAERKGKGGGFFC